MRKYIDLSEVYKSAVLIVHNRYRQRGGEDTVVENEKRLLEEHGHKVYMYERNNAERIIPFSVFFSLKTYIDIREIIRRKGIDIVHVHNTWMVMSPSVYYAALRMKVSVVQTLHNFRLICPNAILYRDGSVCEECIKKSMWAGVRNRCYRGSRLFTLICALNTAIHKRTGIYSRINYICLSEFNRDIFLRGSSRGTWWIDPERIWIKPNFIWERAERRVEWDKRKGFVFAGRITEEKGVKVLIKAWELMGDKAPRLSIYGDGELKDWCEKAVARNDLNISMMGYADRETLADEVGSAVAFIFPSVWYETFGMTVIEAFSVGTPVIASDIGNGKQYIETGKNGLLFKSGSAEDLARAVQDVSSGRIVFDERDISIPDVCTPEENYKVLAGIYDEVSADPFGT